MRPTPLTTHFAPSPGRRSMKYNRDNQTADTAIRQRRRPGSTDQRTATTDRPLIAWIVCRIARPGSIQARSVCYTASSYPQYYPIFTSPPPCKYWTTEIQDIIVQLRKTATIFQNRVGGAAEYAAIKTAVPAGSPLRYASAERRAGLAWLRIIRRCVVPRRGIGRRRVIGRRPITHVIEGRRLRDRSKRRRDDCRGGNGYGARRTNWPGQCKRRVGGIVFRLGGRERQSGELGGERYRTRNSADTHVVSRLGPCRPRPANVVRRAKRRSLRGLAGVG